MRSLKRVPLDQLKRPQNPIRSNLRNEDVADLVTSIKAVGILQPLLAKPVEGGFEILDGDRRLLALQILGEKEAPVVVDEGEGYSDDVVKLHTNLARLDVDPVDEGLFLGEMKQRTGWSDEEIAGKIGLSRQYVSARLQILDWGKEVLAPLKEGRISYSVARELAQIEREDVRKRYVAWAVERGCTPALAGRWKAQANVEFASRPESPTPTGELPTKVDPTPTFVKCMVCQSEVALEKADLRYTHSECEETL